MAADPEEPEAAVEAGAALAAAGDPGVADPKIPAVSAGSQPPPMDYSTNQELSASSALPGSRKDGIQSVRQLDNSGRDCLELFQL